MRKEPNPVLEEFRAYKKKNLNASRDTFYAGAITLFRLLEKCPSMEDFSWLQVIIDDLNKNR